MGDRLTIGIVSPGAMGSALGRSWQRGGARVVTTVAGRSDRTRRLADGLELLPDLAAVVATAELVVSIGPPDQAVAMADRLGQACQAGGHQRVIADLNAIATSTAIEIAERLAGYGCLLMDGSISGGPPTETSKTRLYLSGTAASALAELAAPGLISTVVGDRVGVASAVKMCTASVYKGFTGLLLQALRTARYYDVLDLVVDDLTDEFGQQLAEAAHLIALATAKSDRFPGEMRQIARTQQSAGARPELFEAMALVYEQAQRSALAEFTPESAATLTELDQVLRLLDQPS